MPTSQILRGAPATVEFTLLDQDGQPRTGGDVTVEVLRSDGTVLIADETATTTTDNKTFAFDMDATQSSTLDILQAKWTEDGGATFSTFIEIVGNYYFSLDEARKAAPNFTDSGKYPHAMIRATRAAVEEECERITNRAFVPRFRRYMLSGTGTDRIWLPDPDVSSVRAIAFIDENGETYDYNITPEMLVAHQAGRLHTRKFAFPFGLNNVVVEYECGMHAPPQRIKDATLERFRDLSVTKKSGIDRATFQVLDGKVFNVLQPGQRGSRTGLPSVDAAYDEWAFNRGSIASVPF